MGQVVQDLVGLRSIWALKRGKWEPPRLWAEGSAGAPGLTGALWWPWWGQQAAEENRNSSFPFCKYFYLASPALLSARCFWVPLSRDNLRAVYSNDPTISFPRMSPTPVVCRGVWALLSLGTHSQALSPRIHLPDGVSGALDYGPSGQAVGLILQIGSVSLGFHHDFPLSRV